MYTLPILSFLLLVIRILPSLIPLSNASPINSPPTNQSSPLDIIGATLNTRAPRPPKPPVCPEDFGPRPPRTRFFARHCEEAIKMIPRDTRPASPLRNFYLLTADRSTEIPNVELPFEREYGDCIVQLLMASSFMDVPHEQATWMDIWGPSRLILQRCISAQNTGGIITNIGVNEKLDLAIYSKRSLFALTRRLRASRDPVATSIAESEFLQLLGIVGGPSQGLDRNAKGNGTEAGLGMDEEATALLTEGDSGTATA
ncbi:MAG: hypothetical protein Q9216_002293 [Gyalolechia sp. 2 TL-2023]